MRSSRPTAWMRTCAWARTTAPPELPTRFRFPDDHYSFSEATERCVGAGVCRRAHSGTMCPSYMVTLEEKHSTRGRARLLNEMVRGETIKDGWRSEEVRDALDLCLSCKGCRGECPVQVDMATYKAEFLSHYYRGRLRPRHAYSSGLIYYWARMAAHVPTVANFFASAPLLGRLLKFLAGYSQRRHIPPFAHETFKRWFQRRARVNEGGPRVILWPDTFNNHFTPAVAQAAVQVLEHAGFAADVEPCTYAGMHQYGAELRPLLGEAFPDAHLVPASEPLSRLAAVLTEQELARVRLACHDAEHAYVKGVKALRSGLSEYAAAELFRAALLSHSSQAEDEARVDGFLFCMSGPHGARAHAAYQRSRRRLLVSGDLALIHCNSYRDGFFTDTPFLTRPEDLALQ